MESLSSGTGEVGATVVEVIEVIAADVKLQVSWERKVRIRSKARRECGTSSPLYLYGSKSKNTKYRIQCTYPCLATPFNPNIPTVLYRQDPSRNAIGPAADRLILPFFASIECWWTFSYVHVQSSM
jgi:hypothetical protein